MRKRLRPRITFANVVSCLALFVALGSGAYAAGHLPKNSVGTKQLKKNAVTTKKINNNAVTLKKIKRNSINSAKVKENSLTGADINLAKLGTVPSANVANMANALSPPEASHLVGAPGEPAFEPGITPMTSYEGLTLQPVGFYKDHDGIVHLQGVLGLGGAVKPVFTLPEGYRPASGKTDVFLSGEIGIVLVFGPGTNFEGSNASSKVFFAGKGLVSLDGITFRAES
jgi:hypothetical protein